MHDALPVRVGERIRHLRREAQRVAQGQLALAGHPVAERFAVDEGHDVVQEAVRVARVVERQDVWMVEARRDLDLAQEPLGPQRLRQLGAQHLERDLALVLHVGREVHRRHAAGADLSLEAIAAGECGVQPIDGRAGVHGAFRFSVSGVRTAATCAVGMAKGRMSA